MKTDTRQRILSFIQGRKNVRPHDLVKEFRLSNVAIHKQLKKLFLEGKIKKMGAPPLVFYSIAKKPLKLEEIKQKVLPILKKARVKRAAIFGSYARGDNTQKSDIDVLLDLPDHATLIDLVGIKQDLEEVLRKKVDVIEYEGIHHLLRDSILSDQYPIL